MADEILEGVIQTVVYANEETGWAVLKVKQGLNERIHFAHKPDDEQHDEQPSGEDFLTVVGYIPNPAPGEFIEAGGRWANHQTHGVQFAATTAKRSMPSSKSAILEYLASGVIRGIGRATAKLIIAEFGDETLDIIERQPELLSKVRGINKKRAVEIGASFSKKTSLRRLMELLIRHDLSPAFGAELMKRFGVEASERLGQEPYILLEPPFEETFAKVDKFAEVCGVLSADATRLKAGIIYELYYNANNGHVYLPKDKLIPAAASLLRIDADLLESAFEELALEKLAVVTSEGAVYLPHLYDAECNTFSFLKRKAGETHKLPKDFDMLVKQIEAATEITYTELQRKTLTTAAESGIMVLTGGPGTGKTTTVRGILDLYDLLGFKTLLAAPTGRAAKRMSELSGREASTVHRLLEFGYDSSNGEMRFLRDSDNPLNCDAVILDETSMLDIILMEKLALAMPREARLILVGDPDQLPAVGPGAILEDILKTEDKIPTVRLAQVFRQAAKSLIVTGAHDIIRGVMPKFSNKTENDLFLLKRQDTDGAIKTIIELCAVRLPDKMGIPPEQIQVLTPTRKGLSGTVNLNKILQSTLNPAANHKLEKTFGEFIYREGDRVMQIRNNYDIPWRSETQTANGVGIFNGEIGTICEINLKAQILTVRYDDRFVDYPFDALSELEPAYALTVHKAQGSEYRAVVFAALPCVQNLKTRRILYTAVTRAREILVIVGNLDVVADMVANDKRQRRFSGLCGRLTDV